MKCPYCDFENKPTSKFCENCGARLIPDESKAEQNHAYDGVSQEPYTDAENVFSGAADDDGYDGTNQYGGQEPPFQQTGYDGTNQYGGQEPPFQQTGYGGTNQYGGQEPPFQQTGYDGTNQYGGQDSPYQQANMPQGYGMPPVPPKKKNSKIGIAVLILGILGMGSRLFGLIAIGLGVYDLIKNKDKKHVLVIIGIVLAALGILFGGASSHRVRSSSSAASATATPAPTKAATATPVPTEAPTATPVPTEAPTVEEPVVAEPSTESAVPEAANGQDATNATSSYSSYEEIYETYAQKIRDAAPGLVEEYEAEAAENTNGLEGLAQISSEKIGKLAEITTEGTSEMASFMMFHGSGDYDEYEEWAGELYDVYEEEAEKITSAYLDSASSAAIDDLDLEDFDLGDFNLDF